MRVTTPLRVGIVGWGWMGQAHARAYARLRQHFPGERLVPDLVAVADSAPDDRLAAAATAYGVEVLAEDWRELITRADLDAISVTGPNFIHRDVAVAAAEAGKHVWLEKPAGRDLQETTAIAHAVVSAGVQSACGFNYRNAPAVERARELVDSGALGTINHVLVRFLADYAAHPDGALSWRFDNEYAGSGVLGDLVSHAADLAAYVAGPATGALRELVTDQATFIAERPEAAEGASHFSRGGDGPRGAVGNEDYVSALLRFDSGARGIIESSRVAVGSQCEYLIEVHGDRGALAWDFRRMGELRLALDQDFQNAFYRTEYAVPGDGALAAFQPGTGIAMSYDDLKVIEAQRFVRSIADGKPQGATIHDAVHAAAVVDAMQTSAREGTWVSL